MSPSVALTFLWCSNLFESLATFWMQPTSSKQQTTKQPLVAFAPSVSILHLSLFIDSTATHNCCNRSHNIEQNVDSHNPLHCTDRGTPCKRFRCNCGSYRRKDPDVQDWNSGIRVTVGAREAASLQAVRARLQAQGKLKPLYCWLCLHSLAITYDQYVVSDVKCHVLHFLSTRRLWRKGTDSLYLKSLWYA